MESQISNLLALGVVAGFLNAIVGLFKGFSSTKKKLLVTGLSMVLGLLYYAIVHTGYINAVISVLGVSQLFYAFFVKK